MPRTLGRTLRAGMDATAGSSALVTAACVRMVLRRIADGEPVGPALRECCYFDAHTERVRGCVRCGDYTSRGCTTCTAEDIAAKERATLPIPDRIVFEAALVAAFQARLIERLSWER